MPSGKPGDHPITDVIAHGSEVYSPRVNQLIRDVHALGGLLALDELMDDLFEAERLLGSLDVRLVALRERLGSSRRG